MEFTITIAILIAVPALMLIIWVFLEPMSALTFLALALIVAGAWFTLAALTDLPSPLEALRSLP